MSNKPQLPPFEVHPEFFDWWPQMFEYDYDDTNIEHRAVAIAYEAGYGDGAAAPGSAVRQRLSNYMRTCAIGSAVRFYERCVPFWVAWVLPRHHIGALVDAACDEIDRRLSSEPENVYAKQ